MALSCSSSPGPVFYIPGNETEMPKPASWLEKQQTHNATTTGPHCAAPHVPDQFIRPQPLHTLLPCPYTSGPPGCPQQGSPPPHPPMPDILLGGGLRTFPHFLLHLLRTFKDMASTCKTTPPVSRS